MSICTSGPLSCAGLPAAGRTGPGPLTPATPRAGAATGAGADAGRGATPTGVGDGAGRADARPDEAGRGDTEPDDEAGRGTPGRGGTPGGTTPAGTNPGGSCAPSGCVRASALLPEMGAAAGVRPTEPGAPADGAGAPADDTGLSPPGPVTSDARSTPYEDASAEAWLDEAGGSGVPS